MADLLVVGSGLIGTSVGLALRDERDVVLTDADSDTLARAVRRGAGRPWDGAERADLALVCVPVAATAAVLTGLA
ncbi:MAG: prephenate dehydrogenase/arogenate dehydrogenase family protein, partial [Actinomycetota bacterium]|nr:prephenate dehydrogenase/arogenate dehydrogenase family protein [Actinomycetota bacterium]